MVFTCARNSFWILQKWQIKKPTHPTTKPSLLFSHYRNTKPKIEAFNYLKRAYFVTQRKPMLRVYARLIQQRLAGFSTRFFCGHVVGDVRACPWPATPKPHPNLWPATPKSLAPHPNPWPAARGRPHVPCVAGSCHMCSWCYVFLFQCWQYVNTFKISIFNIVFGNVFLLLFLFTLPFVCFSTGLFQ